MKKISEIMDELGFRPDGSYEVKKAFIKNMIKHAKASEYSLNPVNPDIAPAQNEKDKLVSKQMSLFEYKKQTG